MAIVRQKKANYKGNFPDGKPGKSRDRRARSGSGLDQTALAHKKLLCDPCNGNLAHPVYGGGRSGYLVRCATTFNIATQPGARGWYLKWLPGIPSKPAYIYTDIASATDVSTSSSSPLANAGLPYKEARCVAACAMAYYTGKEIDRSGFGFAGNYLSNVGDVQANGNTTDYPTDQILQYRASHPDSLEAKWFPATNDQLFRSEAGRAQDVSDSGTALSLGVSGMNTSAVTSYRVVLVAVYEWLPEIRSGLQAPQMNPVYSKNSAVDVVASLAREGVQMAGPVIARAARTALIGM